MAAAPERRPTRPGWASPARGSLAPSAVSRGSRSRARSSPSGGGRRGWGPGKSQCCPRFCFRSRFRSSGRGAEAAPPRFREAAAVALAAAARRRRRLCQRFFRFSFFFSPRRRRGATTSLSAPSPPRRVAAAAASLLRAPVATATAAAAAAAAALDGDAWTPYLRHTALRAFGSVGAALQLGRFIRPVLDYTHLSARLDLGLTSAGTGENENGGAIGGIGGFASHGALSGLVGGQNSSSSSSDPSSAPPPALLHGGRSHPLHGRGNVARPLRFGRPAGRGAPAGQGGREVCAGGRAGRRRVPRRRRRAAAGCCCRRSRR